MDKYVNEEVYDAEDIRKILNVSRTTIYRYLEDVNASQKPFRVLKIGKLYRVPKVSFDNWIQGIAGDEVL